MGRFLRYCHFRSAVVDDGRSVLCGVDLDSALTGQWGFSSDVGGSAS